LAIIRQTSVPTKHAIRRISADSQIFNIFHPVHIKVALVAILRFAVTAYALITAPRCFIHLLMASLREGAEACCWCRWHRFVFLGFRALCRPSPRSAPFFGGHYKTFASFRSASECLCVGRSVLVAGSGIADIHN